MSLRFIIDGYNLIKHASFRDVPLRQADARIRLLEFIKRERLSGSMRNKVTVVFDGYCDLDEALASRFDIEVIFSRRETADETIKRMVENSADPRCIAVVSDDREIRLFVKSCGSRPVGIDEFLSRKDKAQRRLKGREPLKPELNYTQIHKINQELKKLWLK